MYARKERVHVGCSRIATALLAPGMRICAKVFDFLVTVVTSIAAQRTPVRRIGVGASGARCRRTRQPVSEGDLRAPFFTRSAGSGIVSRI